MSRPPGELTPGAVAVVIPTKDRATLLVETLRSLREQTLAVNELVIADDGSTDHTAELARDAGAVYVYNEGGGWGVAGGRNAGLAQVTSEYVAFVDSDDLVLPHWLETLRAALERAPQAPFAYGRALSAHRQDGGWRPSGLMGAEQAELERPLCSLFERNSVHASGALARTAAVKAAGGCDTAVRFSEDHHLWVRLAQTGAPVHLGEILTVYRHHPGNIFAPLDMLADHPAFMALADGDPRLDGCQAGWNGVHVLEGAAEAVRNRNPRELTDTVRHLLIEESCRTKIIARAIAHFRRRRRLWRAGLDAWEADAELRSWLARFA